MNDSKQLSENEWAADEQNGRFFRIIPEHWFDRLSARLSILYLVGMLVLLSWALFRVWVGHPPFLEKIVGTDTARLNSPLFRLMAYTALGGGLGAVATGIRSFMYWHLDNKGFGARYFWKYFSLPPLGALLAVIVYATIRAGLGAIGGNVALSEGPTQSMSAFAIGALAGYGSHQVFVWLDDKVSKLFKVTETPGTKVPDLIGKTRPEAEATLTSADLTLGKVNTVRPDDPTKEGKVVDQTPTFGSPIPTKGAVNITIATLGPKVPDATGKTQPEAQAIPKSAELTLGTVNKATSTDPTKGGKVVDQAPTFGSPIPTKGAVNITVATLGPEVPDATGKNPNS